MAKNLGIGWPLYDRSGWGVYGINLTLQLLARHPVNPILLFPPIDIPEHPLQRALLSPLVKKSLELDALGRSRPDRTLKSNITVLCALGDGFHYTPPPIAGKTRIGVIFFEDMYITPREHESAGDMALLLAGSSWNEKILKDMGVKNVRTVIQGIDPAIFHPAPRSGFFGNRFVIFSGGKLEYRKGQDIVIAAFRAFHQRHPEALLLTSWHNPWPESMKEIIARGHVSGVPSAGDDPVQGMRRWLQANGLPDGSFVVLPDTPNIYMANVIRESHAALFTNRAEGGTNLVAMECLASGVPVILSANTGHMDFADDKICYPLRRQGKVLPTPSKRGVEEWGETDVEEAVETLEEIYRDYPAATDRAGLAADHMRTYSWENQIRKMMEILQGYL